MPMSRAFADGTTPQKSSDDAQIFPSYREGVRRLMLREFACGPLSLLKVFDSLGVRVTDEQARDITGIAGTRGTSMLQLKRLAEEYRPHAAGVELRSRDLAKLKLPAVVLLNGRTFAAVTDYRRGEFLLTLPLSEPHWRGDASFAEMFGAPGRALLVSQTPLDLRRLGITSKAERQRHRGARLRVAPSIIPVGRIQEQNYTATTTLFNDGDQPLAIDRAYASCSCIGITLSAQVIPPASSVKLQIEGEENELGPFSYTIIVQAPDSQRTEQRIPIHGFLEPPLWLDEPAVSFDPVLVAERAQRTVPCFTLGNLNPTELGFEIPDGAPLTLDAIDTSAGPALVVSWLGSEQLGWQRYEIQVGRREIPKGPTARLLVAAHVVPRAEVSPALATISPEELEQGWVREMRVTLHDRNEELTGIDIPDDVLRGKISIEQSSVSADGEITVSLIALSLSNLPASGAASLVFRLASGDMLRVPITWGDGVENAR